MATHPSVPLPRHQGNYVTSVVGEISSGTAEQSQRIGEIGAAAAHLDQMTRQNTTMVEQSATAAERLKEQTHNLATVIGAFKIGDR